MTWTSWFLSGVFTLTFLFAAWIAVLGFIELVDRVFRSTRDD